jgi:hypothetical protein
MSVAAAGPGDPWSVAILRDGGEMPFDLFLGVPLQRPPPRVTGRSSPTESSTPAQP